MSYAQQHKLFIGLWGLLFVSSSAQIQSDGSIFNLHQTRESTTLNKFTIEDSLAVCNDGSPSVYYFSEGDPSSWLIYLEGGAWCYDEATCASRFSSSPSLMSSVSYADTVEIGGLFSSSSSESPLSSATKVFVKYCSSDGWGGDVSSSNTQWDTFGWSFKGRVIVNAVMQALQINHGLGSSKASVVFGGTSAGGRGAMFNIDHVVQTLPNTLSVVGLLDSPYWIDIQPLYPNLTPMQNQTDEIRLLANISGSSVIDSSCESDYATELWKCLYGQYRIPYLKTKYLMYASSFDAYQFSQLMGTVPTTQAEIEYADNFAAITQQLLTNTLPATTSPYSNIYSQACYNHAISTSSLFYTTATSDGVTESMSLQLFLSGGVSNDIDNCTSFNCGSGCVTSP